MTTEDEKAGVLFLKTYENDATKEEKQPIRQGGRCA